MPYASRDGVSLYYARAGSGEPALVFVHGWCCDHTFFAPQFEHFGTAHTVVTLDLRGCGASDQPDDGYGISALADDVAWLCGELELALPVLVGHSIGGLIAIDAAARNPGLAGSVVAVDPGPIDPLPETRSRFERFAADLAGPDGDEVRRSYVESLLGPQLDPELGRRVLDTMCAPPLDSAAAVISGMLAWDGLATLSACDVPLLVLRAEPGGSNEPARLLPTKPDLHCALTVGAGHFNQLEVPEQVTPMIERFLEVALERSPV